MRLHGIHHITCITANGPQNVDFYVHVTIYFREPSGVPFEIATLTPGFTVDEDPERLGESLSLPGWLEHKRAALEKNLTPIENPRGR